MLPDFPKLKSEIHDLMMTAVPQAVAARAPMSALIPKRRRHEGEEGRLTRADGTTQDTSPQTFSATAAFPFDELGHLSLATAFERYVEAAGELAEHRERFVLDKLEEVTRQTGNVVDTGGKPFSPDLILDALETVEVDFDEAGQPIWPTMFVSSKLYERMASMENPFDEEPYQSRWATITEKKRQAWYAREGRRQLVG